MKTITLRNHKAFIETKKTGQEVFSLVPYLTNLCEIGDNFTFGDLFSFIEKDLKLIESIFGGSMGNFPLIDFVNEIKKEPIKDKYPMDALEIYKCVEIHEYKKELDLTDCNHFHGLGKDENGEMQQWAIEGTALHQLRDIPLKLKKKGSLSDWRDKSFEIEEFDTYYSLFDVINSVLYEITFYGSPANRDKQMKELFESLEKEVDEGKCKSFEEVKKDLEERIKKKRFE